MRKIIAVILFVTIASFSMAQNVVFKTLNADHSVGDLVPDTVEVVADSINQIQLIFDCFVSNETNTEKEVKIKREIVEYVPGAMDQLCWGTCTVHFETDQNIEKPSILFAANETMFTGMNDETNYEGLGGAFHYLPAEQIGTTSLKYTLVSVDGLSEVEEDVVVVKYTVSNGATSIRNNDFVSEISEPYPNPAHLYTRINYDLGSLMNAELSVYNIIGTQVKTHKLRQKQGSYVINTSSLPAGMYFVNVEYKGQVLNNRKLLVE